MSFQPNPERYALASKPHASLEEFSEKSREFWDKVQQLRVEYQIADLMMIYTSHYIKDNEEHVGSQHAHCGDPLSNLVAFDIHATSLVAALEQLIKLETVAQDKKVLVRL